MMKKEILYEQFKDCTEPLDIAERYPYFKKRNSIKDNDNIQEMLKEIEKINFLGALYIAVIEEPEIAQSYIKGFLERNRKMLTETLTDMLIEALAQKAKSDNGKVVYYIQIIYLCLLYLNEEERVALCRDVFSNDAYMQNEDGNSILKNEQYVSQRYAKFFSAALGKFDNSIEWEKGYYKIATSIYDARNEDIVFLHYVEVELRRLWKQRNKIWLNRISDNSAKEYFELLCKHEDYDAAKFFLDKFVGNLEFFGMEPQELFDKLYRLPAPRLWAFCKKHLGQIRGEDYTYEEWYEDIISHNQDVECLKWMKLTIYYHSLKECIEHEQMEEFENLLNRAEDFTMFDMDKIRYLKQIVESFAFIVNNLLLNNKYDMLMKFLDKIDNININAYSRTKYLSNWNQLASILENYNYSRIEDCLFEKYKDSLDDAVKIYMNTHLKGIINIEEFTGKCASIQGENLYDLFSKYPLWGRVTLNSERNSVRDKLFISTVGVASKVSYYKYTETCVTFGWGSREAQNIKKKMIRSHEDWYSYNKGIAELMRNGDECTFYIDTFKKGVGVLVKDLALPEDIEKEREERRNSEYPSKVLEWLENIQMSQKYIEWDRKEAVYGVMHLKDMKTRIQIALKILDTVIVLQKDIAQLEKFLFALTNPPLEEINEFRYILTSKWKNFQIRGGKDKFWEVVSNVSQRAEIILNNEKIPAELRKDIYLNTCIRKFYKLEEACKRIGDELYLATAKEPFILALELDKEKKDSCYFKTQKTGGTLFSQKKFKYTGEYSDLKYDWIYLMMLKEYDSVEECFVLEEIDVPKEKIAVWNNFFADLYDINDITDEFFLSKKKEKMKKYSIKFTSQMRFEQFVYELDNVFSEEEYEIPRALKVIDVLDASNPFADMTTDFSKYREKFEKEYIGSYRAFVEKYKEQNIGEFEFCDLYFNTYLKVFVDFDTFIEDITEEGKGKKGILVYCKSVGYL